MAFGLLGGEGAGDPLDLYGDLFSDKQKAALRQRELSSGLLRFAEKLGQASAPSRAPKGSFLGLLGQSLGGFAGGDEAANKQLEAMALAEKVRQTKQQRELGAKVVPFFWQVAGGGIVQAPPDTPPAPGAVPLGPAPGATPAAPGAVPQTADLSGVTGAAPAFPGGGDFPGIGGGPQQTGPMPLLPIPPAPPGGRITPADYGVPQPPGPGLGTGLLPPPPGANPQMGAPGGVLTADLYGGGTGSPFPFSGGGLPPGAGGPEDVGAGGDRGGPDVVIPLGPRLQRSDLVNVAAYGASREGTVAYWKSRGAPDHVAQGIADRVNAESGFKSDIMGDKGTSGGLYQHHADRLARLKSFAAGEGKPWTDPDVQHRFAGSETQGGDAQATRGMPAIMAAPDRQTAAKLWDRHFERSAAGSGSGIYDPNRRIGITPLSGEAVPAGQGGVIPGLNMTPQQLGAFNALFKMSGLGDPFGSLLETYYKSPGYLGEAARTEAEARKKVEFEYAPKIKEAETLADLRAQQQLQPELQRRIEEAKNNPKLDYEQRKAIIDRESERLKQLQTGMLNSREVTVTFPDGRREKRTLTNEQILRLSQGKGLPEAGLPAMSGVQLSEPVLSTEQTSLGTLAGEEFKGQHAAAKQAAGGIMNANNLLDILQDGALVGPGSDLKVGYKRFAQMLNDAGIADIRGENDEKLLANTEAFVSQTGQNMVAVLKSFVPASNIDVKAAERIAGSKDLTLGGLRQILSYIEKHGRKQITDYNLNLEDTLKRSPIPNAESLVVREPPRHGANIAVNPETGVQMWEKSPGKWVRF